MRKLNFSFFFKQFSKLIFDSYVLMIINIIINLNVCTTIKLRKKQFINGHAQFRYRHFIAAYFVPSVPSGLGCQRNLIGS